MTVRTIQKRLIAMAAASALVVVPIAVGSPASAGDVDMYGWEKPFAGPQTFLSLAPKENNRDRQVNMPLGQARADALAARLGFSKDKVLSKKQYAKLIAGKGKGGGNAAARKAAQLIDASAIYLSNTTANPLYRDIDGVRTEIVLASYGLIVDRDGNLSSPAIDTSPVRQVNWIIAPNAICRFPETTPPPGIPCGYMGKWMRKNGAKDTLKELYASAYAVELPYAFKSQGISEPWELAANTRGDGSTATVGMAMVPSIWFANFLLLYALNPKIAANMPAFWTDIPAEVVDAIEATDDGKVAYADYQQYFN
ncbi:MAG: hypothetical protein WAO40_00520 [Candidatus Nanopelagicales bacterium]|nr:hypothetical protein [Candidatus Nanopelagicales bacterium]MDP4887887.1 hypothetical protein [Candidatus Nanopelagicales bacterium]